MMQSQPKFSASGSMLGYLYQCRCALLLLLRKTAALPDPQMSVERFDDVTFDEAGGPREAIQTKHHGGTARSLSDSSVDLWKTLRVWCEGVRDGTFAVPGTAFTLITTQSAPDGGAASLLRQEGRDPARATALLLAAASNTSNREIRDGCDAFDELPPAKRSGLVEAVYVCDGAPGITDIEERLSEAIHYAARREHREAFLEHLEGWWLRRVIRHLSASNTPPIRGADLEDEVARIRDGFREGNLPIDRPLPDPPLSPDPDADARRFVERLRRIGVRNPHLSNAILDFYRASTHRSKWVRHNLLGLADLGEYDARLLDEWGRKFAALQERLDAAAGDAEKAEAGRALFDWTGEVAAYSPAFFIRPLCTEPCIPRGTFHKLADEGRLAWHPDEAAPARNTGGSP